MLNNIKTLIQEKLNSVIFETFNAQVSMVVEEPKDKTKGDIAVPSFVLAKILHKNPMELTGVIKEILEKIDLFSSIEIVGPYVNAFYSKEKLSKMIIDELNSEHKVENKGTVCIDYSSPNIAKNFSIGHLRSTIIGESLGNLLEYQGYKAVRINHLGDFGTQFGKLIYAYLNWGEGKDYKSLSLDELVALYVRFHAEAEEKPELDDEARRIFNELENGNEYYNELWSTFKNNSLKEFDRVYELLGVHFDEYSSEANASHNAKHVLKILEDANVLEIDDGATIVRMEGDMPPAIVKRSDGATLYITRDLEEIHRRYDKYHFDKMLYCVGNEQKLYFNQLKQVLKRIDAPFKDAVTHVNFGLVLTDGKKMSTRSGNAVKLVDVLNEAIKMSLVHIEEKNPNLENKEEIAKAIGVSSVIFNDLKNYRENNYEFSLEDATKFEGLTGPYVQYTSVRIGSILNQAGFVSNEIDYSFYNNQTSFDILKELDSFDDIISKCVSEYAPNYLAKYLLNLSALFNNYYAKEKILVEDEKERNAKIYFLSLIKSKLDLGMKLLGMRLVNKM